MTATQLMMCALAIVVLKLAGTPVPQDVVDKLHELYYERLQGMWRRHRHRHPSFADAELVLIQ
jgi:hypothetical protein